MNVREVLNIHFCPTCAVDTMPSDLTGECFWCSTKIAEPAKDAKPSGPTLNPCAHCGEQIPEQRGLDRRRGIGRPVKYCSDQCRRRAWLKTDKGYKYRDEYDRRKARERWDKRRAQDVPEEPWKARPQRTAA